MLIPLKYNMRSLLVRRASTVMMVAATALVVAVFVIVMAMVAGVDSVIKDSGSLDNVIVVRKGATNETTSSVSLDQFDALKFLPQIRRGGGGDALASPELALQVLMRRMDGGREYIIVRGMLPIALEVHERVRLAEGRMFNVGVREVIVGKALVRRYRNCTVGSTLAFGRATWRVVGIFEADGSSFESEVWGDLHEVQDDSQWGSYSNSVRLKLASVAEAPELIRRLTDDPRINMQAESEPDYYRGQSLAARELRILGMFAAGIMAVGAIFAGMNTMYAAVSARTQEIGTLRALGFSRAAVMCSFQVESLALALVGGLLGTALATPINGLSTTFGNFVTVSTLAFDFRVTFRIVVQTLWFAAAMGLAGGWLPAWQAMRTPVVDALRKTD